MLFYLFSLPVLCPDKHVMIEKRVSFITITQLCLSGLSDRGRLQANAAMLGVSLLMEDVLNSGGDAEPVRLHCNKHELQHDGKPNEVKLWLKCAFLINEMSFIYLFMATITIPGG